jgi:putative Holliday junction resolvase
MRWLGVDAGEARVGLGICDEDERVAVALEVVPASAAFPAIRSITRRESVGGIVVGLPLTLDGREGDAVAMARRLGERLERQLALPVEYEDERLTSAAARRGPAGGGGPTDDIAAALLLQQFIDRRRRAGDREDRGDVD